MCSTPWDKLAEIGQAIDDLAAEYPAALRDGRASEVSGRLAGIWRMVCDADPDLARRVAGYDPPP